MVPAQEKWPLKLYDTGCKGRSWDQQHPLIHLLSPGNLLEMLIFRLHPEPGRMAQGGEGTEGWTNALEDPNACQNLAFGRKIPKWVNEADERPAALLPDFEHVLETLSLWPHPLPHLFPFKTLTNDKGGSWVCLQFHPFSWLRTQFSECSLNSEKDKALKMKKD